MPKVAVGTASDQIRVVALISIMISLTQTSDPHKVREDRDIFELIFRERQNVIW